MFNIVHSLSVNISHKLNKYAQKEGLELQKMILGLEIILINVSKLCLVFILAYLLGVFTQTALAVFAFAFLRHAAFGLHAEHSLMCNLSSILMFIVVPYFFHDLIITNHMVLFIFTCITILFYKYAPADTESRPVLGKKNRRRLKYKAMASCILLGFFALVIGNNEIKFLFTLSATYETISILPITYKLFKRSWNNYEQYE